MVDSLNLETIMERSDKHSVSNIEAVLCTHLDLQLTADFDRKALHGHVEFQAQLVKNTTEFVLDSRALNIQSATINGIESAVKLVENEVFGTAVHIELPAQFQTKGASFTALVHYETTPESTAIQWLPKEQTADKKYPYLFTQCQAIHARALLPCQDCPLAKTTYTATIAVPVWAQCLMSAVAAGEPVKADTLRKFSWEQNVAVPSYLIAIVIGHLESRDIGPRSRVWSEPSCVEAVAYEFAQTEDFLKNAEEIMDQEYVWGRYDLVSLPPSFPFGGMENPCLTFATPTLLAGDRSLADVIAHEIAHSWTGNLITNHTWEHFWLNEGWTMWLQRKIMTKIHSNLHFDFDSIIGWCDLQESIDHYGRDHKFTKLVPDLSNCDPDDSFSSVPYEKGFNLLYYLSKLVGDDKFEVFAKEYVRQFKFKTVTSDLFKDCFIKFFKATEGDKLATIDWDTWFYGTGMPTRPSFDTTISSASAELASKWMHCTENDITSFDPNELNNWTSSQIVVMLESIIENCTNRGNYLEPSVLCKMGDLYNLKNTKNSEVRFRYQTICIRSECRFILPDVETFLKEQGRMKFVRPLYRDLFKSKMGKEHAIRIFNEWKLNYHPIAKKMIAKDILK